MASLWNRFCSVFAEPPPRFSRQQSLEGVPVVNPGVTSEAGPRGERMVVIPRRLRVPGFLRRWLRPEIAPARLFLDGLGSFTWEQIDGKTTVGEIVSRFAARWTLHPREAESGVIQFLNLLMKRGAIAVVMR